MATIPVKNPPTISKENAALLEEMLPFYDRLAEQTGDDLALKRRAAGARRRVGDIHQRLGQYDQAVAAYRRAIEMYRNLAAINPKDKSVKVALAESDNELGETYLSMRKVPESQQAHEQALSLLKATGPEGSSAARFELARTHFFLGRRVTPEPGANPPRPGRRPPPDQPPRDEPEDDRNLHPPPDPNGETRNQHLQQAVELLSGLAQKQSVHPDHLHLLALCLREMEASPNRNLFGATDKAIEILEGLVRDFPQVPDYSLDLCETYAAVEAIEPGQPGRVSPQVESRLTSALKLSRQLIARYPNVPEYLACQARIHHRLGQAYRQMRRFDEAEQSDREALDVQARLAREFPQILTYRIWAAAYRNSLADTLLLCDKPEETQSLAQTNIAEMNQLLKDHPDLWYLHAVLMDTHHTLATAQRRLGQEDLASQSERQAQSHRLLLLKQTPNRTAK